MQPPRRGGCAEKDGRWPVRYTSFELVEEALFPICQPTAQQSKIEGRSLSYQARNPRPPYERDSCESEPSFVKLSCASSEIVQLIFVQKRRREDV